MKVFQRMYGAQMGFDFLGINENSYIWQTKKPLCYNNNTMMHCDESFIILGWKPLEN